MKLSETEHEIYVRFNQSNSVWVEFALVKSEGRFLAFRCNAFRVRFGSSSANGLNVLFHAAGMRNGTAADFSS